MTTDRLSTTRRRGTDRSRQFAIGIVIAVAAVLGIEYGLQQITRTPPPRPTVAVVPAETPLQTETAASPRPNDQPGYANVRDVQPPASVVDTRPDDDIRYFPVRGEVPADSQFAELQQPSDLLPESSPDDHADSNQSTPADPAPARLAAPVAGRATPIHPRPTRPTGRGLDSHDERLRSIIRQELPGATADEHEIWLNALRGLAPRMVRQLLRLRQVIRGETAVRVAETSRLPDLVKSTGLPRAKPRVPDAFPAPKPLSGPPLASRPRTVSRVESAVALVPESLRQAVGAIDIARDAILGNIANANTIGFKRRRVFFEDLVGFGRGSGSGVRSGLGVRISEIRFDHSPGPLRTTRGSLDLAIDGDGFFQIQDGPTVAYTRAGNFQRNADGQIVLKVADRYLQLEPAVTVPQDTSRVVVAATGMISVKRSGAAERTQIGAIQLARFSNPAGLEPRGGTLYAETKKSGPPRLGLPGTGGRGKLRPHCLEDSNVRLRDELRTLQRLQQQLLAIRQTARILSESGGSGRLPTKTRPAPLVRETDSPTGPDGPRLSRQPSPQQQ